MDTVLFTTVKVYIPMVFGKTIVCDRFVYDTLIDVAVATRDYEIYNKAVGKLFLKLIPEIARIVMLNLDKDTVLSRRDELKDDITFDERYELYKSFSDEFGIKVVYNAGAVENVNKSAISVLGI